MMPQPTAARFREAPSARRLGALALLALAGCVGGSGSYDGPTEPICIKCLPAGTPSPPPEPERAPPSHHLIVRGVVRDPSGASEVGAQAWISFGLPAGVSAQMPVEGSYVPTPADGSFRMRLVVGYGSTPPQATFFSEVVAERRGFGKRASARIPSPTRPLSEPADSVQVVIVIPH